MKKFQKIGEIEDDSQQILELNGDQIIMELSDERTEITFYNREKQLDGEFEFVEHEFDPDKYLLKRMYTPEDYIRKGLGELALFFFKDYNRNPKIFVRSNDGITRNDGSHLTGDAVIFTEKMKEKGLIEEQSF